MIPLPPQSPLPLIHQTIDARVDAIRQAHPDWLCGKGCDGCCQHLAEEPCLSPPEWQLLQEGIALLSPARQAQIAQASRAQANTTQRPLTCPLLDTRTGACPVYAHRPVACRSYGFYVQRDKGLYCQAIEQRVAAGKLDTVVWGNHDALDQQLERLGERRRLSAWLAGPAERDPGAA